MQNLVQHHLSQLWKEDLIEQPQHLSIFLTHIFDQSLKFYHHSSLQLQLHKQHQLREIEMRELGLQYMYQEGSEFQNLSTR